jgi:hypothetical protein
MALGGAIGTACFASGLSVNVVGPAIILSYAIVAGLPAARPRADRDGGRTSDGGRLAYAEMTSRRSPAMR